MKQIKFSRQGNDVMVMSLNTEQTTDTLAPAIYVINNNPFTGFYLRYHMDKFKVPEKIYGSACTKAERVMRTYSERSGSTGILLTGHKGSGKTMLSSILANKMIEKGFPVLLVEKPYGGSSFSEFLNNIGECVLFFDEFGKIFREMDDCDPQESLLSVFDGTQSIKRMILLTENETHKINDYMLNRPGRVFYHFRYDKLEEDLVREYCANKNIDEDTIEAILFRISSSKEFSFDVLQAVIEEYLRFGGDIKEIFKDLNIEQPYVYETKMKVTKIVDIETQEEKVIVRNEAVEPDEYNDCMIVYKEPEGSVKRINGEDEKDYERRASRSHSFHLGIKDLVKRTENGGIYKCEHNNLAVALEYIAPQRTIDYSWLV